MQRRLKDLGQYAVYARDGEIGGVGDSLLDETQRPVHHVVVATNGWWTGDVLIAPHRATRVSALESCRTRLSATSQTRCDGSTSHDSHDARTRASHRHGSAVAWRRPRGGRAAELRAWR